MLVVTGERMPHRAIRVFRPNLLLLMDRPWMGPMAFCATLIEQPPPSIELPETVMLEMAARSWAIMIAALYAPSRTLPVTCTLLPETSWMLSSWVTPSEWLGSLV